MKDKSLSKQSEKCLLWKITDTETGAIYYETWIKISKPRNQGIFEPTDEDFGVWAWSHYTLESAQRSFDLITSGQKKITPMVESID